MTRGTTWSARDIGAGKLHGSRGSDYFGNGNGADHRLVKAPRLGALYEHCPVPRPLDRLVPETGGLDRGLIAVCIYRNASAPQDP